MTPPDPPTDESVTGSHRRPTEPSGGYQIPVGNGRTVPLWALVVGSALGLGTGAAGGGGLDLLGLGGLHADVRAMQIDMIRVRHELDRAMWECGCTLPAPFSSTPIDP